jgi:hypothetical protein
MAGHDTVRPRETVRVSGASVRLESQRRGAALPELKVSGIVVWWLK